jgi:hypothetical protein
VNFCGGGGSGVSGSCELSLSGMIPRRYFNLVKTVKKAMTTLINVKQINISRKENCGIHRLRLNFQ